MKLWPKRASLDSTGIAGLVSISTIQDDSLLLLGAESCGSSVLSQSNMIHPISRVKGFFSDLITAKLNLPRAIYSQASTPLLALFPESQSLLGRKKRISYNWDLHGISHPYAIFITGRCGSTLLTNLIKDMQLAGAPEEYFNVKLVSRLNSTLGAKTLASYFDSIVQSGSCGGSFGVEIDWVHLRQLEKGIDFTSLFPVHKSTFFYMTRRDIVAQAWSYATAKATGLWQRYSDKPQISATIPLPALDDKSIWAEINLLLEAEFQMEQFFIKKLIKPIRIDYEGLLASKKDVLGWVLLNIGCDTNSIIDKLDQVHDRTLKIQSNNFEQMLAFRAKYNRLLADVQQLRGSDYSRIRREISSF
jgi:LPS sulfotransferase NodH